MSASASLGRIADWTQEQAATACDISTKVFQFLENGHQDNPTLATVEKICRGFGIGLNEFFQSPESPKRKKQRLNKTLSNLK